MSFFDSHCHLNHPLLMAQSERVRANMAEHKVSKVLVPATCLNDWPDLLSLPALYPEQQILFALGIHPYFVPNDVPQALNHLGAMLTDDDIRTKLSAIGEIGLDFVDKTKTDIAKAAQLSLFQGQITLAKQHRLPIVLHSTHAVYQCIAELKAQKFTYGGYAHAFGGSIQEAKQLIDLNFKIGIGPMIYHQKAVKFKQIVKNIPMEHLALETDAPYPIKEPIDLNRLNMPGNVAKVFNHISDIHNGLNNSNII